MTEIFLSFSADKLSQLSDRIEDCLSRLTYDQVWKRAGDHDNSIGNLVLHLCGNVSQWILAGLGGLPYDRHRDAEFAANGGVQPGELSRRLHRTVFDATVVVRNLDENRMLELVEIQKYNVTVLEAVYHVVEHFAGHAGQIIFATKLLTGEDLGYYKHLSQPAHHEATP